MNGSTQQQQRMNREIRRRRARATVVASIAALVPTALSTIPAEGTVERMADGHNITVFHNIDFVATFGHTPGLNPDEVTVEVRRNNVVIGTATGDAVGEPPEAGLEVNHGPEGAPVPGDCWEGHTPDIRPGDHIIVRSTPGPGLPTTPAVVDEVIVDDIQFTGRPRELRNGDIVVPFQAFRAAGRPIPASFIDSPEFRAEADNQVRFERARRSLVVERRPGARPGQMRMRYKSPFQPARNRPGWNQRQLRRALLGDGHATGFGHVEPLPEEGMLVDGLRDTPGPAAGCPGVSARWQVSKVSPAVISRANRARPFRVAGRTFDAERVMVRLVDRDAGEPVRTVEKRARLDGNTWTVQFRPGQLRALDGRFRISSLHTLNGETRQIGGPSKFATRRP